MPTHARKSLRDALVAAVTGLSTTGSNVRDHVQQAVSLGKFPALVVKPTSEPLELIDKDWVQARDLTFSIVALTNTRDQGDQVAYEVEVALAAADIGFDLEFLGTSFPEVQDQQGESLGFGTELQYRVRYHTQNTTPDTLDE